MTPTARGAKPSVTTPASSKPKTPSWAATRRELRELTLPLYLEYNTKVFGDQLPMDLSVTWSAKLQRTAGQCLLKGNGGFDRSASIELSEKVLDSEERLRKTLAHEMCHAGAWLIDGMRKPPHGGAFRKWADKFERQIKGMKVTTCHSYDIFYKFRYGCVNLTDPLILCGYELGRQSKSVDLKTSRCPRCNGKLQLLGAFNRDGTVKKEREPTPFAMFMKVNYSVVKASRPGATQKEVMSELSKQFKEAKQAELTAALNAAAGAPGTAAEAALCLEADDDVLQGDEELDVSQLEALRLE